MPARSAAHDAATLREQFLLDPEVIFLNHGSYGACPAPVFAVYQEWQRELERQPVEFLGRRCEALLDAARASLADYLAVSADDLVFVTNATSGLNVIARSLPLRPGDEVLATDLEYGALDLTWEWLCGKAGARYVRRSIALPVTTPGAFVDAFWSGLTPRTRAIFLSHITSGTALILPIEEICKRARAAGILTIVDGAHAPGQIPLDLTALDVDIYAGNCHKWLCAPKGSGFLYVRPEHQAFVESLTISWGWRPGHNFVSRNQWQGTRDLAAFLATPAAIEFQEEYSWDTIRWRCHSQARRTRQRLSAQFGLPGLSPDDESWYAQMVAIPLPLVDPIALGERLYQEYRIEVPLTEHLGQQAVRVSVQGYTTDQDLDALVAALTEEIPN